MKHSGDVEQQIEVARVRLDRLCALRNGLRVRDIHAVHVKAVAVLPLQRLQAL